MSANIESIAYNRVETPWHGLGVPVDGNLSTEEMLKAAGLDWTVSKRQTYFDKDGVFVQVPGQFALVRDTDQKVLTSVGANYKPVQNADALEFFDRFVKSGDLSLETAGSLDGGRYIWALARLNRDFAISRTGEDEVRPYLLLSSPHVFGKSLVADFTAVRVVCQNTLRAALGDKLNGTADSFRLTHNVRFDDAAKEAARAALGLAFDQATEFAQQARVLARKQVTAEDRETYFCEVLEFDPSKADHWPSGLVKEPRMLSRFRQAVEYSPGANLLTAEGTLWGAVNAVTYVVDHGVGKTDKAAAFRSAWLGDGANLKQRAFDLALSRV